MTSPSICSRCSRTPSAPERPGWTSRVIIDHASDELRLTVDDDGSGLTATPEQTLDPFYTTKPGKKTGLGLSLLKADAQAAGGDLTIGPSPSLGGVRVETFMQLDHVDRPPARRRGHHHHRDGGHQSGRRVHREPAGRRVRASLDHGPPQEAVARLRRLSEELVT